MESLHGVVGKIKWNAVSKVLGTVSGIQSTFSTGYLLSKAAVATAITTAYMCQVETWSPPFGAQVKLIQASRGSQKDTILKEPHDAATLLGCHSYHFMVPQTVELRGQSLGSVSDYLGSNTDSSTFQMHALN